MIPGPAGKPRRTLRRRLGFALGLRLLIVWALTTLAVAGAVRHELNELYDASLLAVADAVETFGSSPPVPDSTWRELPSANAFERTLNYHLRERMTLDDAALADLVTPKFERLRTIANDRTVRISLPPRTLGEPSRVVEIAQGLEERYEAIVEVVLATLLPVLVVIPVCWLGLRTTLNRELAPLDALAAQIDRRDGYDLSPVAAPEVPEELRPLVNGVNGLLKRLRRALDAEHDFAGTTAHELRTPLAGALAQTQRLLVETEGAAQDRTRRIERSLHDLERLTSRLLELARAEGVGTVVESAVDLAPMLGQIVELIVREHASGSRVVLDDEPGSLYAHLDADAFSVLLRNLVDNAVTHGSSDASVVVRRRGRQIDIENAGPVLEAAELVRLRERFVRGVNMKNGNGLGLAIVYAIVAGGGIDVTLRSPCPVSDDGLQASVQLL